MTTKQVIGIVVAACGAVMMVFSNYIATQVTEGRGKISRAQRQVDTGKSLFSLNPVTEQVGKGVTSGAQRKIDKGRQDVAEYEQLARQLQIGGIVLLVLGGGLVFLGGRKTRN